MPSRAVNPWIVLVLVCLAQFMVVLDATVTNVALPSIQADLKMSDSDLQWIVNAYTLVFGGFLLLGGRAGDLVGRKRVFLAGVVLFTAASALCGVASSQEMLIIGRGIQGLGAALVSPAALSIVTTTFAEGPLRTKAMGVWAAIAVGGGAVGLLAGGILTEYLSWEWVFFVNIPIGVAAVLLSMRYVPESKAPGTRGVDVAGAVSVTAGLTLLVFAIVKTQDYGWVSAETIGLAAAALALLAAFVVIERRSAAPLVRLGIFRSRSLTGANLAMLAVAGGMFSGFYFASIYLQQTLGLVAQTALFTGGQPLQSLQRRAAAQRIAVHQHADGHRHGRCQRLGAGARPFGDRRRRGRRAACVDVGEGRLDRRHDLPDVQWLDEVGDGAKRLHLRHGGVVGEGGQEHERDLAVLAQVGGDVETAFAFHADVQQREVGPALAGEQDGVVAVVGLDDLVAGLHQAMRQRRQHQPVVVHHQDPALACRGHRHALSSKSRCSGLSDKPDPVFMPAPAG